MLYKQQKIASGLCTLAFSLFIYKYNQYKLKNKKTYCFSDLNENLKKRIMNKETDFYIWGKGQVENTSNYTNFHPHRIKNINSQEKIIPKNIIDITFNEHLAAGIDKSNNLFVWREPRLNSEKKKEINNHERNNVMRLAPNLKVVNVSFTKDKLFLLDKSGNVYVYNITITLPPNEEFFVSALPEPEVELNKNIIPIKELKNIVTIATGKDHFIAIDKEGKLYGMGDDSFGQLGLGTFSEQREQYMKMYSNFIERRERMPKLIDIPEKVKKVVCGENHTVVLTEHGNVYGFGYNRYLQLSNDPMYRQGLIGLNKPTMISADKFKNMKVVDIAASKNCSYFVCKNETDGAFYFFSAGEGLRGQLGQNVIKHMSDVEEMPDISGLINSETLKPFEPLKLKCGLNHCILLFKNPRVIYVWGNNEFGELGTKDRVFYESPIPMLEEYTLPFNILNFGVGALNSAFICEKVDPVKKKKILAEDLRMYEEEINAKKTKKKRTKKQSELKKAEEASEWKNKIYQVLNNLKKYI